MSSKQINKKLAIKDLMSSKFGDMIRNAVTTTLDTGRCGVTLKPIVMDSHTQDELTFDDVTIYADCISCKKEFIETELANKKCKICICEELREKIVLCDDINMSLSERVDYFNCECSESNIVMTKHIFNYLKNFYRIDDKHVRFDVKNKMMKVKRGCENELYDVY